MQEKKSETGSGDKSSIQCKMDYRGFTANASKNKTTLSKHLPQTDDEGTHLCRCAVSHVSLYDGDESLCEVQNKLFL